MVRPEDSWQNLSKGRRSLLSILNVYYGAIENIYEDRILKTDKFWTFHITGNLFKKWSKNNYLLYTCIYTLPIAEILSGKNVRAWVLMVFTQNE